MAYRGGWTTGMAPHILDLPFWALDLGYPTLTMSSGGKHVLRDAGDAPDTHEVLWQFPGLTLTWMMSLVSSYAFDLTGGVGDDGARWRGGSGSSASANVMRCGWDLLPRRQRHAHRTMSVMRLCLREIG